MHGNRKLKKLSKADVLAWLDQDVFGREYAPDTQRASIQAYEQFEKFIVERQFIRKPLVGPIKKPTGRRREWLPERSDFAKILRLASPEFSRIIRCLRFTAARPNELCRATIADYDRDKGMIVLAVHKTSNKTGKPRVIVLGKRAKRIVERCIGTRTEGLIFLNANDQAWTPNALSHHWRRLRDKAGVDRRFVLYILRHWTATLICALHGIQAAKEALGHATITMTDRYVHADKAAVAEYQDRVFSNRKKAG